MSFDDSEDDVTLESVKVVAATAKAICVEVDDEEHWIPRSRVLDGTEVEERGDVGRLVIPAWLARDRGLE